MIVHIPTKYARGMNKTTLILHNSIEYDTEINNKQNWTKKFSRYFQFANVELIS